MHNNMVHNMDCMVRVDRDGQIIIMLIQINRAMVGIIIGIGIKEIDLRNGITIQEIPFNPRFFV
jgi:hypothetical protein